MVTLGLIVTEIANLKCEMLWIFLVVKVIATSSVGTGV